MRRIPWALAASVLIVLAFAAPAAASDTLISVGSPETPFSQNKQNEPALAVDQSNPNILVAGRQRQHRHGGVQLGRRHDVPVHAGRRQVRSLVLARRRLDLDAADLFGLQRPHVPRRGGCGDPCAPLTPDEGGLIGTLPWYYENGLVSDGDPASHSARRRTRTGPSRGPMDRVSTSRT